MKSRAQLEKEIFELKTLEIVFDESEHLRGTSFEAYLKRLGKQNLGKQIEQEEGAEVAQEMTKKQREYDEYLASGGQRTFKQWKETIS